MNFPSVGLRRVENRFDEQIAHYLRKKQQLRHLKEALDEMPEGEFCTFHPAVNPPPKYLQNCPRRTRAPNDPLVILERFCSQLTEDREYPKLVEAIRECTFQPNIHKFVAKEKKTQQAVVEIQSEAKADAKKCAVGVAQGKLGAAKGRSGEFDDAVDGSPSTQNRVDSLFNTLDQPFNYIFAADIKQWLKTEADNYSASDEEAVEKKKQQGWKRWEVEGRTPQYRGPFKDRSRQRLLAQGSGELVVDTQEVAHTRTPSVAPKRRSTPYNEWVDGLRGGYVPNDMDFHVGPSERGNEKKLERYEMRDWSRYIRLDERAVETRVIPNEEIIDAICESELPSAVPPPPTIWVRRRRWVPGAERGPDAATYTATHFHTGDEQVAGLVPAGKPAALTRQQAKAFKKPFPQPEPTTFVVPTPLKLDRLRQKYRLYMQLRNGTEVGEIRTPPRVVALRKDVLKDIEAEVLREPPSLVLADADGDSSAPSTAETDESDSEAGAI
ncbi:hypothetical protein BESB_061630 [Besnoitia besnoiti]|uniref:Uncharacterized protein n=1 Tax=Besnoitia besnoiti TaxID=94643 RepID=A0A2A9MH40_BESBE|nr:hypothetical protein BESB_061630 [Besnoitia besnoiti]PFH35276.1 hypothetical protein BESB_061630 [Besnoitia besnoiti]